MFRTFGQRALLVPAVAGLVGSGMAFGAVASTASSAATPVVSYGLHSNAALSNWGGYIARASAGTFTVATAHWKIATVTCRASSDLYAPWVGIDGDGDTTVEQTGVQTACNTGRPVSSAWYEMYPAAPVYFSNAVSTGDSFTATVTYSGGQFTITISDTTKKWTHTVHKTMTAKRLSAEAVIEAPGGGNTYPSFKAVTFTGVKFNGANLSTWHPVASDTGTTTHELVPTAITNGNTFSMVPKA